MNETTIVFFDGLCGLCNRSVDFLMRIDKKAKLRFAPLQGATAETMLSLKEREDLDTVFVFHRGKKTKTSDAWIAALTSVGGIYSLVAVFKIVPRFLRDAVYRFVANRRYKWFGKKESCRIPSPNERSRFLP